MLVDEFIYHSINLVSRAREALRQCLPDQVKDNTFAGCLKDDNTIKKWLTQLLQNLTDTSGISVSAP